MGPMLMGCVTFRMVLDKSASESCEQTCIKPSHQNISD